MLKPLAHITKYSIVAMSLILLGLYSCKIDDTDFHEIIEEQTVDLETFDLDTTALVEPAEVIPSDPLDSTYDDYLEHQEFTRQLNIVFNGNQVTVSGDSSKTSIITNGAHVTVSITGKKVKLVLSGNTSNGSLKVYGDNKYQLELNGVSITNPTGAAINNQCGKRLFLTLADSTRNTLADGATYTEVTGEDQKGCLFSEGKVLINGKGLLTINAKGKSALATDDYLRVRPGVRLMLLCKGKNGIKANDGVFIGGGVINIDVSADGSRGIACEAPIVISGGRTSIVTSGNSLIEEGDTTSCAAVKCDTTVTITAGILNCMSGGEGGKGINAGQVVVSGGEVNMSTNGVKEISSPKALKADSLTISDGDFYAYSVNDQGVDVNTLKIATDVSVYKKGKHFLVVQF